MTKLWQRLATGGSFPGCSGGGVAKTKVYDRDSATRRRVVMTFADGRQQTYSLANIEGLPAAAATEPGMGRAPADYPRDVATCAKPPTIAKPLPIGDGAALIARRPDIRGAERTLAAATARIGVATANLYPQVSLGGSVGLTGPLSALGSGDAFISGWGR